MAYAIPFYTFILTSLLQNKADLLFHLLHGPLSQMSCTLCTLMVAGFQGCPIRHKPVISLPDGPQLLGHSFAHSSLEVAITPDEDSSGLVGTSDAFYLCWDILNSSESGVDISLYASGPLKGETNGETIDWSLAIGEPKGLDSGTTKATRVVETFAKDETNGYYTSEAPLQIVTYTGNAFGDKGAVPLTLTTVDASKNQKDTYKATLNAVIATI